MAAETHPDKMGHAKYFMMVHEAYQELDAFYHKKPKPKRREKVEEIVKSEKGPPCTNNKFNQYFEENKVEEIDPFSRGYKKYMTHSNVREDIEDLKKHNVKRKQKQIVKVYEPEPATNHKKWLDQVGLLGVETIEDFTCQHGTDYMNAYQEPDEVQEKHKYYNSVDEIEYERSNMDYRMSKEEMRKRQEWEKEKQKMEYKRRQTMKKNDDSIFEQYRLIHERLC